MPYRLRKLTISSVDSVDRGAGLSCEVILAKRRAAEAADPISWPRWEPPSYWEKEREMNKSANPFGEIEALTAGLRNGEIGKNCAFLKARDWFEKSSLYDLNRKDAAGRTASPEQQFQHALENHPILKRFNSAHAQGLRDTQAEVDAYFSQQPVEKAAPPPQTMSRVINDALNKAATELLSRAKRDRIEGATFARCYKAIITKSQWGRSLASLEKFHRTGIA
jgi:hypothetical protein